MPLIKYYERQKYQTRASIIGVVVLASGLASDELLHLLRLSWFWERLWADSLEALIVFAITFAIVKRKDERIKRRFRELAYLNHHIRNSVSIIQMANYLQPDQRDKYVMQACERILKCVEKISREEDVGKVTESPEEP